MSTADKLNKLLETKEAIKQAIIDKGGTVGDVFAEYPTAIQNIQSGSGTFVVPEGIKFAYSSVEEFPGNLDWSEVAQAADHSNRFYYCQKLTKFPKLTISNATNTSYMFGRCSAMKEIDMSNWDLSNVTNTSDMFSNCKLLKSIKWGEFNTSSNKNFNSMFAYCELLQSVPEMDFSSNTSTYSSGSPFSSCYNLRNVGGLKGINKSINLNNIYSLSYNSLLNIINGLADGVSGQILTLHKDLVNQLTDDDIAIATNKGWSISPAKTMTEPIVVTDLNQIPSSTSAITPRTYDFSQYTGIWGPNNPSSRYTLLPCRTSMYQFEADITNTTDASYMFGSGNNIRYIILHNTHNVTNMQYMFRSCDKLVEVRMDGDVSNVENVTGMFEVTSEGTFYYNPAYDYSKIIAQLPETWTAVPLTE